MVLASFLCRLDGGGAESVSSRGRAVCLVAREGEGEEGGCVRLPRRCGGGNTRRDSISSIHTVLLLINH